MFNWDDVAAIAPELEKIGCPGMVPRLNGLLGAFNHVLTLTGRRSFADQGGLHDHATYQLLLTKGRSRYRLYGYTMFVRRNIHGKKGARMVIVSVRAGPDGNLPSIEQSYQQAARQLARGQGRDVPKRTANRLFQPYPLGGRFMRRKR